MIGVPSPEELREGGVVSVSPPAALSPDLPCEPVVASNEGSRPKALFVLERRTCDLIYGAEVQASLREMADFYAEPQTRESVALHPEILEKVEVIFSGWGAPRMDRAFLDAAPNLKAVFYGAGTIGYFVTEDFWNRGIVVTGASEINAQPVAEYTLGTILLGLKNFWGLSVGVRDGLGWGDHTRWFQRIPLTRFINFLWNDRPPVARLSEAVRYRVPGL